MVLALHLSMAIRLIKVQVDYPSHPAPDIKTQTVADPRADAAPGTTEVSALVFQRLYLCPNIPLYMPGTSIAWALYRSHLGLRL